jgi:hypothetical protein
MVIDVMIVWIVLASQLRLQLIASQVLASIAQGLVDCQPLWATRRLACSTSLHIRHWPSDQLRRPKQHASRVLNARETT